MIRLPCCRLQRGSRPPLSGLKVSLRRFLSPRLSHTLPIVFCPKAALSIPSTIHGALNGSHLRNRPSEYYGDRGPARQWLIRIGAFRASFGIARKLDLPCYLWPAITRLGCGCSGKASVSPDATPRGRA